MHSIDSRLRSSVAVLALTLGGCSADPPAGSMTSSAGASAPMASSPSTSSGDPTASTPVASVPVAPSVGSAPKFWKPQWGPWGPVGDTLAVNFVLDNKVTAPGLPDLPKCEIDGPFLDASVSFFGAPCEKDTPQGCFEVAQALYQYGRWKCAEAVHAHACSQAPNLTKPPQGGGDYAMAGWPQCPVKDDPRFKARDQALADPMQKACYVEHKSVACAELAMKLKEDDNRRIYLLSVAEAWDKP